MALFLDLFPKVNYDINRWKPRFSTFDTVTDLTFRLGFIRDVLSGIDNYYMYTITDGDTPEILADKVYGTPEAHWIILYANNIVDPQYDWPLDYRSFNNYIVSKYGSIENAKTNIHHYEKIITKTNSTYNVTTVDVIEINKENLANSAPSQTFDYYDGMSEFEQNVYDVGNSSITEEITRRAVSFYDYEDELNESKRQIKIIRSEYYQQLTREFRNLTNTTNDRGFIRRLR